MKLPFNMSRRIFFSILISLEMLLWFAFWALLIPRLPEHEHTLAEFLFIPVFTVTFVAMFYMRDEAEDNGQADKPDAPSRGREHEK